MVASIGLVGTMTGGSAIAGVDPTDLLGPGTDTKAHLSQLNNSDVFGRSEVDVHGRKLDISVDARHVLPDMPHAMHIHFGAEARHECPSVFDDDNADHRLSTAEGQPAYGPIRVSLTKHGDTSPESGLAVDRFPNAPGGEIHYDRTTRTDSQVARAIRRGNAVVVIHGIDYNQNHKYDFEGAGKSELDPAVPAEATDPVTCGVLKVEKPLPDVPQP